MSTIFREALLLAAFAFVFAFDYLIAHWALGGVFDVHGETSRAAAFAVAWVVATLATNELRDDLKRDGL